MKSLRPREAMRLAEQLGWEVTHVFRTGEVRYRSPDGRMFYSKAPGRRGGDVNRRLAAALAKASGRKC